MADKLFASADDFRDCIDRGMVLMRDDASVVPPNEQHLEDMKALYAIFLAAVIDVDNDAPLKPDFSVKTSSVRMALLAAYNLGKQAK